MSRVSLLLLSSSLLVGAVSCSPHPPATHSELAPGKPLASPGPHPLPGDFLPVTADDPAWGDPLAPVTVVEFADLACHYCAKAERMVAKIREHYGPSKIRLVWKHNPLSFHRYARQAAEIGAAVFDLQGEEAFLAYETSVFKGFEGRDKDFVTIASEGLSAAHLQGKAGERVLERARLEGADKVDRDLDLAEDVSIGWKTPTFFVNGVRIVGAAKESEMRELIDAELEASEAQLKSGTPANSIYAERLAENVRTGKADDDAVRKAPKDATVYFVPIEGSPVRGAASAPVTIVEFVDFEDTASRRFAAKVEALRLSRSDDIRLVVKQNPAPENRRSEPASEIALGAYALGGEHAFWVTHDGLVANKGSFSDADFVELAKRAGIDSSRLIAAVSTREAHSSIARDQDLADDLEVEELPAVYVNGKHFLGGASKRELGKLVDAELASAKKMIASGARPADVYSMRMTDAEHPPPIVAPRGDGPPIPPGAPIQGSCHGEGNGAGILRLPVSVLPASGTNSGRSATRVSRSGTDRLARFSSVWASGRVARGDGRTRGEEGEGRGWFLGLPRRDLRR